ncbi:hypothetical protein [Sphingomonas koreensis]|uniref:hypothetical protein n=1 Tax=Sphingomonas koreensis TaxID=93064 RepID=UPI000F7F10B9|nr:hypothetical protein [Sphingomonas koreensis]
MSPRFFMAAAMMVSAVGSAQACRSPDAEDHVFFAHRPTRLPDSVQFLKVRVDDPDRLSYGHTEFATVTVLEKKLGFRAGEKLRVKASLSSSCSHWGHTQGFVYVAGYIRRHAGRKVFEARSYRPFLIGAVPRKRNP